MSVEYFIDTNVLVYSFDENAPEKRAKARELIAGALRTGCGVISCQVVQEFLNVALHKWLQKASTSVDLTAWAKVINVNDVFI